MNDPVPGRASRAAAALVALAVLSAPAATGAGFFDAVPRKGYVRDDVMLDVLDAAQASAVVARVRYVRLFLDPGRRDIAYESWPVREMLLVERATGERLAFERVSRLPEGADGPGLRPSGRIGLSGSALEAFERTAPPAAGGTCAALDLLIRAGNTDLPVASGDLGVRSVRSTVARVVQSAFSPKDLETIAQAVPILFAGQSAGLPEAPLEMLKIFFPGVPFARTAQGLSFRTSSGAPLNPADGAWRSVTDAPDMLPGAPLF